MSTKVEPHPTTANMSSGTKISFAVKKGFVIPKNKLSGSLVPTFRGAKKGQPSDVVDEESNKQPQRKTKWGPDLTQDTAVRKARALAYQMYQIGYRDSIEIERNSEPHLLGSKFVKPFYNWYDKVEIIWNNQTRVDQITEQLKSGFLETEDSQEPFVVSENPNLESSIHQKSELLELERREAIGEILKLNPSYKPPSDYKPLLKEAKVPVPTKEHPGYNFSSILFGPSSDTLKQLEKETGAKIRVCGTKANTRDKAEIISADANVSHGAYEELYVHITADTYDKVDAAVALVEMLIKQVLVNQASVSTPPTSVPGDDVKIGDQTQVTIASNSIPPVGVNLEYPQQISGPAQTPQQTQFQPYSGPWFSQGPPQPPTNIPNTSSFFSPSPVPQPPFMMPQGQFGPSPSHPQPVPVARPSGHSLGLPLAPPHGPHPHSIRPNLSSPTAFTNMPPRMSSFTPNQTGTIPSSSPLVAPMSATSAPPPPPPLQARIQNPYPGNAPSFTPVQQPPAFMNQNLHRPNLDNFTFQPQRPQNLPSQAAPRPMMQNNMTQNQPFRPVMQNPSPQAILEALLRPLLNQTLSQFTTFPENSNFGPRGPRNDHFPGPHSSRGPHDDPRNYGTRFPPRAGNSFHPQQNFQPTNRPHNYNAPNIHRGRNISASIRPNPRHGTQQVYDPFSPTAVSNPPSHGGNLGNMRKQEDDPEYENLMNSVGLK